MDSSTTNHDKKVRNMYEYNKINTIQKNLTTMEDGDDIKELIR